MNHPKQIANINCNLRLDKDKNRVWVRSMGEILHEMLSERLDGRFDEKWDMRLGDRLG